VIFSLENLEAIQSATAMANQLYCQFIQAAHPGKMPEELPSFPLLAKAEVDRCRSSTKYQPHVGLVSFPDHFSPHGKNFPVWRKMVWERD